MSSAVKITSCFSQNVTVISNDFLDRFLPIANGDFIRVYLYLIRAVEKDGGRFSTSDAADHMNLTENDILRALRYWEKNDVLKLTLDESGNLTGLTFTGNSMRPRAETPRLPSSDAMSAERLAELGQQEDIRELLFIAAQYVGKPLTRAETQKICYFYDSLKFSPDLIDYLIEYCVSHNHKSFHYIEKVALAWHEQGIANVRAARAAVGSYHREYYDILKALGINNHHPVDAEIQIMKKWLEVYNFSMDIIREACSRTVMNTPKPSLKYADGILTNWFDQGINNMDEIRRQDEEHIRRKNEKNAGRQSKPKSGTGSFGKFGQRTYDYDSLETQILNNNQKGV